MTVRELLAELRFAERGREVSSEYGGDGFGEDEDEWRDALGAAIRAIALEDGTGGSARGLRGRDEDEDVFLDGGESAEAGANERRSPFTACGASVSFLGLDPWKSAEGFQAASVKLKRVKKMNKHKHRKRRKRDRAKNK